MPTERWPWHLDKEQRKEQLKIKPFIELKVIIITILFKSRVRWIRKLLMILQSSVAAIIWRISLSMGPIRKVGLVRGISRFRMTKWWNAWTFKKTITMSILQTRNISKDKISRFSRQKSLRTRRRRQKSEIMVERELLIQSTLKTLKDHTSTWNQELKIQSTIDLFISIVIWIRRHLISNNLEWKVNYHSLPTKEIVWRPERTTRWWSL